MATWPGSSSMPMAAASMGPLPGVVEGGVEAHDAHAGDGAGRFHPRGDVGRPPHRAFTGQAVEVGGAGGLQRGAPPWAAAGHPDAPSMISTTYFTSRSLARSSRGLRSFAGSIIGGSHALSWRHGHDVETSLRGPRSPRLRRAAARGGVRLPGHGRAGRARARRPVRGPAATSRYVARHTGAVPEPARLDGRIYFHTGEGRKTAALAADPRVCMAVTRRQPLRSRATAPARMASSTGRCSCGDGPGRIEDAGRAGGGAARHRGQVRPGAAASPFDEGGLRPDHGLRGGHRDGRLQGAAPSRRPSGCGRSDRAGWPDPATYLPKYLAPTCRKAGSAPSTTWGATQ